MSDVDKNDSNQEIDPRAFREVAITFNNFTSSELKLRGSSLEHGIFNPGPPQTISAGSVATWKAESDGILTGTEGYVWYVPATGDNLDAEFQLYWDNPTVGSNSYSSTVKNDPKKLYTVTNAGTAGNSSSVSFSVLEVSQNWNASSWMAGISDSTGIGRLTIPGTHDSCATYSPDGIDILGVVICQEQTLTQQFNNGIRFVDIRCRVIDGGFAIHHGIVYQRMNFDDVLTMCSEFLSAHPSETILMRIKQEEQDDPADIAEFKRVFNERYFSAYKDIMYSERSTPVLGSVRGKIVLVSNAPGVPGLSWSDVQDNFDPSLIQEKIQSISKHLDSTISDHLNGGSNVYYNFVSKQGIPFTQSISQAAEKLNPITINLIAEKRPPVAIGLGVIIMDFPNRSGGVLQILINSNFRIINETFYELRQDNVPKSATGDKITVPFTFITDGKPPAPGSKIKAVAPQYTQILDMSHSGQETLSIASDGTEATVSAGLNSTSWQQDRTVTLLIDADAPEERLVGSLQYFSADDNPGTRCELAVETYPFHLQMTERYTTMNPGGSDAIQYTFTTSGVTPATGSRIHITAPPYTTIVAASSNAAERLVIADDKRSADLVNPEASVILSTYKNITFRADDDIPVDSRFYGSLEYFSSTGNPGTRCDFEIDTCCFYFSMQEYKYYASPGQTIEIPFTFETYDRLASPGSKIVVEFIANFALRIVDMSRDESEALWIAEDGQTAELVATDGSRHWDASRTLTVFIESDAAVDGTTAFGNLSYASANNMRSTISPMFYVFSVPLVPDIEAISCNEFSFAPDAGFPTTGFTGAEFSIKLNTGNEADYKWTANVPWITVVDGNVRFVQRGNIEDVVITATPPSSTEKTLSYSFTIKKWYTNNGSALMSKSDAASWGSSNYGSTLPTVAELKGSGVYDDPVRGNIGGLWSEWGDLTRYADAGFMPGDYWTQTPFPNGADFRRVYLTDARVIDSGSIDNPSYAVVERTSRWSS